MMLTAGKPQESFFLFPLCDIRTKIVSLEQRARVNKKPQNYYRVFAPGVPNVRVMSERLTEAEAQRRRREILMAYPAANVRIEKTDESGKRR